MHVKYNIDGYETINRNVVEADKESDLLAYVRRDIYFCDIAIEQ